MDMRTLIAAQRVCRMWAGLIRESRTLQQALFLAPVDQAFPFLLQLKSLNSVQYTDTVGWTIDGMEVITLSNLDLMKSSTKKERYLRPEASWWRMYAHQPPMYTVGQFLPVGEQLHISSRPSISPRQKDGL
ncbi:hypothetical protein PENDEC_c003G02061 [Penicillium decumbens]|uniref:F-box domain-containing protein n=1 Tax=Penicillium decumbens TaxID=69771 RepID=A0A1V6PJF5_PENDC|nr:hypothetical protein PENDEC_c003G02061 [Penicillium decumbens]